MWATFISAILLYKIPWLGFIDLNEVIHSPTRNYLLLYQKKMRENLNIDFQIGFGFELNDYDDAIIGLVDDERWEDPLRQKFIYISLPYFI